MSPKLEVPKPRAASEPEALLERYARNCAVLRKALRKAGGDMDVMMGRTLAEVMSSLAMNHITIDSVTYHEPQDRSGH